MKKISEIKTVKDLCKALEVTINIPKDHHLVAVFKDNDSSEIEGWLVVKNGVKGDYPMYSSKELLEIYGERK